jgi:hypothetical protein
MIAAKNKFDTMVEKGMWNAPTAEEKIVALEAKFNSTMKLLNKKVTFERHSKVQRRNKVPSRELTNQIQRRRRVITQRSGKLRSKERRKMSSSRATHGIGAARTLEESAKNGEPISQRNAKAWEWTHLLTSKRGI